MASGAVCSSTAVWRQLLPWRCCIAPPGAGLLNLWTVIRWHCVLAVQQLLAVILAVSALDPRGGPCSLVHISQWTAGTALLCAGLLLLAVQLVNRSCKQQLVIG